MPVLSFVDYPKQHKEIYVDVETIYCNLNQAESSETDNSKPWQI